MTHRSREEMVQSALMGHGRSLSPSDQPRPPPIKGRRIKNQVTSVKRMNLMTKGVKSKKIPDFDALQQEEGILSDRYHYSMKHNSLIQQTKRKRRKSTISFLEGNATQKGKLGSCSYFQDRIQERSSNLKATKTWANPNKPKSKHFLSIHNQSIKSTPRTYLESRIVKKVEKKSSLKLKQTSIEDLRKLITKMIDEELTKKLMATTKNTSTIKVIEKRKAKKIETRKRVSQTLIIKIKDLKTMTNSLIPSSDTVEDSNYQTQKKCPPQRVMNLQTTQSLLILKRLVNITYSEENVQVEPQRLTRHDWGASKIKKAWKRYRTHKVINQYASLLMGDEHGGYQNQSVTEDHLSISEIDVQNIPRGHQFQKVQMISRNSNGANSKPLDRPDNIPHKRVQIRSLKDALEFIREGTDKNSASTILYKLMDIIQDQVSEQRQKREQEIERQLVRFNRDPDSGQSMKQILGLEHKQVVDSEQFDGQNAEKWEDLAVLDLNLISNGFSKREKALLLRRQEQFHRLVERHQQGKMSSKELKEEQTKLTRWTNHELSEIMRVKKSLQKGLLQATSILNKNKDTDQFEKILHNPGLKKCISDEYIRHFNRSLDELSLGEDHVLRNSDELKHLKQKLDIANSRQKSFPSDQQFFSKELKLLEESGEHSLSESEKPQEDQKDRLKDLQPEDKQDIFQFIFLDLCIEFCQEIYCGQDGMRLALNYITSNHRKPKRKSKGIKTSINVVKQYLKQLHAFINRTNKDTVEKIKQPLGPTALEMLRYMHYSDEDFKDKDEYDIGATLILNAGLFESFENGLLPGIELEPYYTDQAKQKTRVKFLKDVIHIHNKAIFDCLNESLDAERPFGMWGAPFPWKTTPKFNSQLTAEDLQTKYARAQQKVIQCCSYFCGLLVDKQDSLVSPGSKISEQYLDQVKQDRLSRMLAADLLESQERWLFYDDQQTQTLVQISQIVYEILLREATGDIKQAFSPFQML